MSTRMREQIKKLADHIDENYKDNQSITESIDGDVDEEASDGSETTLENMSDESDSESVLDPIEEEPELVTPPQVLLRNLKGNTLENQNQRH